MKRDLQRAPFFIRLRRAPGRIWEWLADVGWKVVSPFERALSAIIRKGLALTELFAAIEFWAVRIGLAMIWPLRLLGRVAARLAEFVLPEPVRTALLAPLRWTTNF